MERIIQVKESDIEEIKKDLALIRNILLVKGISQMSLEDEFNQWEVLSDSALEDFEESL